MGTAARRLALCGWNDDTATWLASLAERADLRAVAIGDERPSALAAARLATGAARYQHLREMVRTAEFDAVLVDGVGPAGEIASMAAARGAAVLLRGATAGAAVLREAARSAARHGAPFIVLRPRLRVPGLSFLSNRLASEPRWRPLFVSIELAGGGSPMELVRDAVAMHARLLPRPADRLAASAAGRIDDPLAITAQLRLIDGTAATLTARSASQDFLRVNALTPAGEAELVAVDGGSTLTLHPRGEAPDTSCVPPRDRIQAEVERIGAGRLGDALDALLAPREAAVLAALERALDGEMTQPVDDVAQQTPLRVLTGGGRGSTAQRARRHLTLVSG